MAFYVTLPAHVSPLDYLAEAPHMLNACLWIIEAYEDPGGFDDPDAYDLEIAYSRARAVIDRLEKRRLTIERTPAVE